MEKLGMDATVFLRFTRMLRNMFCMLGLIGLCIMIPVNVTQGANIPGGSGFSIMTPLFVFGGGLWAQVVVAWATNIVVAYFLWHNYRRILALRRAYLESPEYQSSLHARSVMIRDIPLQLRNEEALLRTTDEVNPTGVLPRVTIGRNVRILPDLLEEHEEAVRSLESVLAKYLKNPDRLPPNRPTMKAKKTYKGHHAGGNVDAIDYLTDRIRELEAQIHSVREQVDKRDAESYGFASWEQIAQAHSVAFAARKKNPQGTKIRLAPRPNDVIWKNLPLTKASRKTKRFFNSVWIALLTLIWLPLNAAIAIFLSNLSNLGSVWPSFQRQLERHQTGWAIVQGIAAPAITSLVYLVLPIIFRRLQIRAGDETKTKREQHVLRNLYMFFTLNNLIIFSIFSAIWQFITTVIKNSEGTSTWTAIREADFFLTITTSLCQISPFWLTFILQRNLGAAIDLAQLWKLTTIWFERTFMAPTPRQNIEWTAPPPFDYSSYYNYFLFYATIALCFSTLQPLILLVTAFYFAFDSILKKYLLMYVFVTKTESGGEFWRTLFNRLVFATILSDVIIGVVVKARGTWAMVAALAPLLFLMVGFKYYCSKQFDVKIKYYAHTGMHDAERPETLPGKKPRAEKISHKFGHPVLYKPLMTPMVHAKARHILSDIYRGRLASEAEEGGYGDIAMQPITKHPSIPHDGPKNSPFEFVSEADQDFANYKNRDDFREEGGDLYGRPEDTMTERSQTPMSFMSYSKHGQQAVDSPYQSGENTREGTPVPLGGDDKRISQIQRKPIGAPTSGRTTPTPQFNLREASPPPMHHPQPQRMSGPPRSNPFASQGDLSVPRGKYTEVDDDRENLLGGAGDLRTPNGEFMSIDRWQTGTPGTNYSYDKDAHGGYDYFRGR